MSISSCLMNWKKYWIDYDKAAAVTKPIIVTVAVVLAQNIQILFQPLGPKAMLDILVIIPCTGNTLAKLANGIADSSVTLAAKAHLRNCRPLVIAVSTNDGLGAAAQNIGKLLARRHIYFVPFGQDDCIHKPNSLVANFTLLPETIEAALDGRQLQPILG